LVGSWWQVVVSLLSDSFLNPLFIFDFIEEYFVPNW